MINSTSCFFFFNFENPLWLKWLFHWTNSLFSSIISTITSSIALSFFCLFYVKLNLLKLSIKFLFKVNNLIMSLGIIWFINCFILLFWWLCKSLLCLISDSQWWGNEHFRWRVYVWLSSVWHCRITRCIFSNV